jgi:LPS-assembly protein
MTHSLTYRLVIMAIGIPSVALAEEQAMQPIQQCYTAIEMPEKLQQLSEKDRRLQILSDRINMMQDQTALFDGNIEILYRNTMLNAAKAQVSQKDQTLHASGGIQYYSPGLKVSSSHFSALLKEDKAVLGEADYQLVSQSGRGYAKEMSAYKQQINLTEASFTTCPHDDNSWALHADKININADDGWGEAWHSVIRIQDVPVFYLPYMTFPVSDKRKSGLLFPKIGSSQKLGVDFQTPYYLNLAENYDATISPRFMSKRGAQLNTEFRYLTEAHQGQLQLEILPDDNDKPADFGSRYLGHFSHSGDLSDRWRASVDFTDVSDDAYLSELGSDYSNQSDTQLYRQASLNYFGDYVDSEIRLQGFEILGNYLQSYAALPQVDFSSAEAMDLGAGLEFNWHGQYAHFRNDSAMIQSADRVHLEPSIRFPLITPAMEFVAETSLLHTRYQQNSDTNPLEVEEEAARTVPKVRLNAKLNMERELDWDSEGALQTFEPQLQYLYIPYRDQSMIGQYDTARLQDDYYGLFRENRYSGLDRIADTNQVTLGWTTRLYDEKDTELFRFSLGQIVYLQDPEAIDSTSLETEEPADSVLASELLWHWSQSWYLNTALQYDSSNERMVKSNVTLDYIADDKSLIQLNHRYSREVSDYEIAQIGVLGTTPIDDKWKLIASYYRDINKHHMIEANFGLQYESCCWAVRMVAKRQINTNLELALNDLSQPPTFDNGIAVQFVLKGFGEGAGFSVSDMLSNGIFGYRRPYLLNN